MKEAMIERLAEAVKDIAGEGYEVKAVVVQKNNGVELDALNIRKPGEIMVPTVYIQRELELLEEDKITVEEAAKHVLEVYKENKDRKPVTDVDIKEISGKDFILQHVEYQLVNAERNAERLETVPAKRIADLAALYRVVVSEDETGTASYVLSTEQRMRAQISVEELDEAAAKNTCKSEFTVQSMYEVMAAMMHMDENTAKEMCEGGPEMFVLSNKKKMNGASIILYNEKLAELSAKLDDDLLIMPSSIHEVLAVPASSIDVEDLKNMVREVNDTEVSEQEILGYSVYRYNRETDTIEVAA
mgnify:FL=1|jgi:hypothetical protein